MTTFAILGYGFIGAIHAATIKKVAGAELVAVIEKDKSKWGSVTKGNIDVDGMDRDCYPIYIRYTLKDLPQHTLKTRFRVCLSS